jgi:hypothetical protein
MLMCADERPLLNTKTPQETFICGHLQYSHDPLPRRRIPCTRSGPKRAIKPLAVEADEFPCSPSPMSRSIHSKQGATAKQRSCHSPSAEVESLSVGGVVLVVSIVVVGIGIWEWQNLIWSALSRSAHWQMSSLIGRRARSRSWPRGKHPRLTAKEITCPGVVFRLPHLR